MEGHPEFQLDMRPADSSPSSSSAAFAAGRPSIGIMSFSGEVFDGTSLNIGDGKAYSKLKRCEHAHSQTAATAAAPRAAAAAATAACLLLARTRAR